MPNSSARSRRQSASLEVPLQHVTALSADDRRNLILRASTTVCAPSSSRQRATRTTDRKPPKPSSRGWSRNGWQRHSSPQARAGQRSGVPRRRRRARPHRARGPRREPRQPGWSLARRFCRRPRNARSSLTRRRSGDCMPTRFTASTATPISCGAIFPRRSGRPFERRSVAPRRGRQGGGACSAAHRRPTRSRPSRSACPIRARGSVSPIATAARTMCSCRTAARI